MERKMTIAQMEAFLLSDFPQIDNQFTVVSSEPDKLVVRLNVREAHLRPGGTISGPSMFSLVDVGMYLAVLERIGPVALAVTTNCSIDFMSKPEAGKDLICETRILKLGRYLAVGDVLVFSEGRDEPVARASLTYSIPLRDGVN